MRLMTVMLILLFSLASCSGDPPTAADICQVVPLPLSADPAGPTVTDVALSIEGDGVVVLATATDPGGTDNLRDVIQRIGVFPDGVCQGTPILVQDDLACSDCQESFGVAVPPTSVALYNEISAAQTWPVTLEFSDIDGHRTEGRALARIIH